MSRVAVVDDLGVTVFVGSAPRRVVSLSPGATEILYALGLGDRIVAACEPADYPEAARRLPRVGDFANPNFEVILSHRPDFIVATGGLQRELVLKLRSGPVPMVMLYPRGMEGVFGNIRLIGKAFGRVASASSLERRMRDRVAAVAAGLPPEAKRPRVYFEVWSDPPMAIGDSSYAGDLVRLAGGANITRGVIGDYPRISVEFIISADPEVVILSHCGEPATAATTLGRRPGWAGVSAVKSGRVWGDLDMDLLLRPGPRLAEGLAALAERFRRVPAGAKAR
jgi:iron complex transport system substrate-binding protein